MLALGAARRNRTGIPSLEGWHTDHCVSAAVAPTGNDPASHPFRGRANPSQLESRGREAGSRTPSAWSQTRRAAVTLHPVNLFLFPGAADGTRGRPTTRVSGGFG